MKLNTAQARMIRAIAENPCNRTNGTIDGETRADETTMAVHDIMHTGTDCETMESLEKAELVMIIRRNHSITSPYAAGDEIRLTDLGLFVYQSSIARHSAV